MPFAREHQALATLLPNETDLINSVGISILIGVIERVRGLGGELAFSELTQVNEEIFRIMGLARHARLLRNDGELEDR